MAYRFSLRKLVYLDAYLIPCAHLCRYCCLATEHQSRAARFGLERFSSLVDRFAEWGKTAGFEVKSYAKSSNDITDDLAAHLDRKYGPAGAASGAKSPSGMIRMIPTGGARLRSDDGIRDWLSRWRDTGANIVHGTFAGYRDVHDWWNNRVGDYDFLMRVQRIAAEMGFEINQTVFATKNTLPSIQRVIDDLDRLDKKPRARWVFPPAYTGRSRSVMAHRYRITEEDRERLFNDPGINSYIAETDRQGWVSEREQIQNFLVREEVIWERGLALKVTDDNIGHLETTPCEDIVADLQARVEAVYGVLPSRDELMQRYGNREGREIYETEGDVERLWVDRYMRDRRVRMERGLSHLI